MHRRILPTKTTTTVTTQTIEQYVISDKDWAIIESYLKMSEDYKLIVSTFIAKIADPSPRSEK